VFVIPVELNQRVRLAIRHCNQLQLRLQYNPRDRQNKRHFGSDHRPGRHKVPLDLAHHYYTRPIHTHQPPDTMRIDDAAFQDNYLKIQQ